MGRPPKRSVIHHEDVARIQKLANSVAPSNMPQHSHLRGQIIVALTERIKTFWPEEYNHCRGAIAAVAKFEAVSTEDFPITQKALEIEKLLEDLAYQPAKKFDHSPRSLSIQREALIDFLITKQYPTKSDKETRKRWIKREWKDILGLITVVPCRCRYETDHKGFADNLQRHTTIYTITGHADTASAILSSIHDSIDPQSVRKDAYLPS